MLLWSGCIFANSALEDWSALAGQHLLADSTHIMFTTEMTLSENEWLLQDCAANQILIMITIITYNTQK